MSRTASVDFVARLGRPMATSQDSVDWVCDPDLDPEFLMHLLIRSRDYFGRCPPARSTRRSTTRPSRTSMCASRRSPSSAGSLAVDSRIAADLTIDQMTRAIGAQLEAIEALPAALLRRAFEEIEAA
jgi:type I restriction enzyme S subunit